jgi:hypothetical protein
VECNTYIAAQFHAAFRDDAFEREGDGWVQAKSFFDHGLSVWSGESVYRSSSRIEAEC